MRIGIDCDGVLRDFIGNLTNHIVHYHPEHTDKILTPTSWNWEDWLPFWTEEETDKYVFEDNYIDLFGIDCPPIKNSVEDWVKLKRWAEDNNHELVLVSAQREQTKELTNEWLDHYGFDFKERIYTHKKHLANVDILIDDSPSKLFRFKKQSVEKGSPVCFKQTWNSDCWSRMMTINRLGDVIDRIFD